MPRVCFPRYGFCLGTVSAWTGLLLAASTLPIGAAEHPEDNNLRLPSTAAHGPGESPTSAAPVRTRRSTGKAALPAEPMPSTEVTRGVPGPWGDLEYYTVYLEASTALLKSMDVPSYESEWNFVGYTDEQVANVFTSAELPEPIRSELLEREKWRHGEKVVTVRPSKEALLGLPPEARAAIYGVLARWEENPFHREPERVAGRDVREWLQRAELPEPIIAAIEKTVYRRGKNWVLADTPLLLRMVTTEEERLKIRKALTRTPTLVVNLRLTPETNVAALVDYWGSGTRFRDIVPFLESAAANRLTTSLDLIHLLPATVRRLLYTYPGSSYGRTGYYPDCHWTSLNFRNFEPLDRLADPSLATAYVLENYTKVQAPYRYGDVLFLMDGTSANAVHSCVYIADDIVFTKNGRSPTQPWVLMKLDEVVSYYSMYYAPQIACYRRNAE
jgi:hypothetical protein